MYETHYAPDGTVLVEIDGMFGLNWHPDTPTMVEVEYTLPDEPEDWDRAYIPVAALMKFAGIVGAEAAEELTTIHDMIVKGE